MKFSDFAQAVSIIGMFWLLLAERAPVLSSLARSGDATGQ